MTDTDGPEPVDIATPGERLAWMRAEFRAAQQRRYEQRARVLANRSLVARPPDPEAAPPTHAIPSR